MVGLSSHVESSRMEQLTRGRRSGLGGLLHANRYLLISSATAVIGSFLYGTDQGVLSNLLTGENFGAKFPDVYTDAVLKGWVVAVLQLGAWLGALINGPLANKISRKYSITVAAFVSLFLSRFQVNSCQLTLASCSRLEVHFAAAHKVSLTSLQAESSPVSPSARSLMSCLCILPRLRLLSSEEPWSRVNSWASRAGSWCHTGCVTGPASSVAKPAMLRKMLSSAAPSLIHTRMFLQEVVPAKRP